MTNNMRNALKVFADLGVGSGPDHETETYQIERGAIRKAREVLDCGGDSAEKVSELAAPKIKPLVWEHEKATTHVPETWRAKSIGREYDIQRTGDGKFDLWADVGTALSVEDTIEAAQSAAQAHHDQHVRSALQDSPCCKGLAPIAECQCEQDRLAALNKKLTEDFNTLALDRSQWQERAEKASLSLAAEQAINKDLKIELDEALADIEASISDFKVAGEQLSEAQDGLSKLRAMLETAHGKFCKIAAGEAWTDSCLDGYRKTPGGLREFAEIAAKEIDRSIEAGTVLD